MPWWTLLYLAFLVLVSVAGLRDDYCSRRPRWYLIASGASAVVMLVLFVSFWAVFRGRVFGAPTPAIFLATVGWTIYESYSDYVGLESDPGLTDVENRRLGRIAALLFALTFCPAYIVAGIAAFAD